MANVPAATSARATAYCLQYTSVGAYLPGLCVSSVLITSTTLAKDNTALSCKHIGRGGARDTICSIRKSDSLTEIQAVLPVQAGLVIGDSLPNAMLCGQAIQFKFFKLCTDDDDDAHWVIAD